MLDVAFWCASAMWKVGFTCPRELSENSQVASKTHLVYINLGFQNSLVRLDEGGGNSYAHNDSNRVLQATAHSHHT